MKSKTMWDQQAQRSEQWQYGQIASQCGSSGNWHMGSGLFRYDTVSLHRELTLDDYESSAALLHLSVLYGQGHDGDSAWVTLCFDHVCP